MPRSPRISSCTGDYADHSLAETTAMIRMIVAIAATAPARADDQLESPDRHGLLRDERLGRAKIVALSRERGGSGTRG